MQTTSPFAAQQALFRAYDIRGARQYFTIDFTAVLGEVFADLYHFQSYYDHTHDPIQPYSNRTIVVGYDVRFSSDTIARTLVDILQKRGLRVINLGLATTPMMAFWAQQYDGHGIMVTASHSHKDTLGIKWLLNNASPSSLEIQALYQQLSTFEYNQSCYYPYSNNAHHSLPLHSNSNNENSSTNLPAKLVANRYIDAIIQAFEGINQRTDNHCTVNKLNLSLVIDCMNGATSNIAQPLFERFCQRVIMLNDTANGEFPIGNPDPTEPNRLAELQQAVIVSEADMGFAFDGDGDRLMVVDNSGKVIVADHLLYLLAQVAITERSISTTDVESAPEVLFDIKCSHHLPHLLTQLGAKPVMTRTGSSLLRQQLQNSASVTAPIFAGELSGHFIFNDGYFIAYDDAMYAGLRLLHWLTCTAPSLDILTLLVDSDDANIDANIDAISHINSTSTATDVWGDPRTAIPPYQLTDITQSLPTLVSSADHYLPLSHSFLAKNNGDSCTFIEHLVEYCHYLLHLVDDIEADKVAVQKAIFAHSISCECFSATAPMLKTKAEAQRLLPIGTRLCSIDGLRLDFAHGFGVVRRSNTSNSLTVRFAGDNSEELLTVQARFVALCGLFDKELAKQMAAIQPE